MYDLADTGEVRARRKHMTHSEKVRLHRPERAHGKPALSAETRQGREKRVQSTKASRSGTTPTSGPHYPGGD